MRTTCACPCCWSPLRPRVCTDQRVAEQPCRLPKPYGRALHLLYTCNSGTHTPAAKCGPSRPPRIKVARVHSKQKRHGCPHAHNGEHASSVCTLNVAQYPIKSKRRHHPRQNTLSALRTFCRVPVRARAARCQGLQPARLRCGARFTRPYLSQAVVLRHTQKTATLCGPGAA